MKSVWIVSSGPAYNWCIYGVFSTQELADAFWRKQDDDGDICPPEEYPVDKIAALQSPANLQDSTKGTQGGQ